MASVFLAKTQSYIHNNLGLISGVLAGGSFLLLPAYRNYKAWLALGRGGVPYNVVGWAAQWLLVLIKTDTRTITPYQESKIIQIYEPTGQNTFFGNFELPMRARQRPNMAPFIAPQRQERPGSSFEMRELQHQELNTIAAENSDIVEIRSSELENGGPALWLRPEIPIPPWVKCVKGEIAHFHLDAEGSGHVTLSLADATEVIEKGWGERHPLSGLFEPWGYVMLYAPRNEEELHVLGQLLRAGVRFMSGTTVN